MSTRETDGSLWEWMGEATVSKRGREAEVVAVWSGREE